MGIEVMVRELADSLEEGRERIRGIRALGEAGRGRDPELFALLDRIEAALSEFRTKLDDSCGAGIADHDAVKLLNGMLKLEYRGIFDYNQYAGSFSDPDVREKFLKFGAMEIEHARMLIALIRRFGGTPRPDPAAARRRRTITLRELIEEHMAAEAEAVSLCEKGMNVFEQPELQWALGTIRLDEMEHARELRSIYERYKLAGEVAGTGKKYVPPKRIDFDSDEPWTE